jgi:hypothetical protein
MLSPSAHKGATVHRVTAAALLLLALNAFAGEGYLGTIAASTSTTNATTGTAFNIPSNQKLSIQCDATAYVKVCSTATCVAASTNSVKLAADALFTTSTPNTGNGQAYVAAVASTGSVNCKVFTRAGTEM